MVTHEYDPQQELALKYHSKRREIVSIYRQSQLEINSPTGNNQSLSH